MHPRTGASPFDRATPTFSLALALIALGLPAAAVAAPNPHVPVPCVQVATPGGVPSTAWTAAAPPDAVAPANLPPPVVHRRGAAPVRTSTAPAGAPPAAAPPRQTPVPAARAAAPLAQPPVAAPQATRPAQPPAPPAAAPAAGPEARRPVTAQDVKNMIDDYMQQRELFAAEPENKTLTGTGTLIDVSVILDLNVGTSAANDDALAGAIALGDHDPHVRGFNARNEEFVFSADVDPYFYGFFDAVYKLSESGDSEFELEEAYALTTSLPAGLQLKLGQFFTEFGRYNPVHPHAWQFLDYPVILGRIFGGDGWRGQGARVSWIVPGTCFPVTVYAGVQNARGETQAPFYGADGDVVGHHEYRYHKVRTLGDLAWHGRIEASQDFPNVHAGTLSVLGGLSAGWGPNGTGAGAHSKIWGADLFFKWRADKSDAGWPWFRWQTEFAQRDLEAAAQDREVPDGMGGTMTEHEAPFTYTDSGFYSEVVYGFTRPWSVGMRYDHAGSNGIFAGSYDRLSAALSYYPSEFSRIRLQVAYDDVAGLSSAYPGQHDGNFSIWLNFDFSLGKHGAHSF